MASCEEDEAAAVEVILSAFFWGVSAKARALEQLSWLRVLKGFDADDILAAWERYQANGPRDYRGQLVRPTSEDIRERAAKIKLDREQPQRLALSAPSETERVPDPNRDKTIAERAGYTPRFGQMLKLHPRALSRDAIHEAKKHAVSRPVSPEQLDQAREGNKVIEEARAAERAGWEMEDGDASDENL